MSGLALLDEARELLPGVRELRRTLHAAPELGLDLPETRKTVLAALEALDLEIEESQRCSGWVATLRGDRPGATLLLRADMDALPMPEDTGLPYASQHPGRMHACGHDAHTAMLVGAARLLDRHRKDLAGRVKLLFQPGEEGHFGARLLCEEGLIEADPKPDAAFAIHVAPLLAPGRVASRGGAIMAAADVFRIEIVGRGGHASMPHDAVDPIPVACEIVQALQSFVTRRLDAFDPVVLTVTRIEAGTTNNVIPESAHIMGTIRSVSEHSRERAHEGVERVAMGIAAAHDCEARVQLEPGYPVTVNDAEFTRFAAQVTDRVLGDGSYVEFPSPMMGAEDFSYVLERMPGAMVFLGVRPEGQKHPAACHSNRMTLEEDALAHGVALHAGIALAYLAGS